MLDIKYTIISDRFLNLPLLWSKDTLYIVLSDETQWGNKSLYTWNGTSYSLFMSWWGGWVTDHSLLTNLDYASAWHTGFQPAGSYLESWDNVSELVNDAWYIISETDPVFNARLLATPPLYSETDPVFSAWLLATPPLYSETDPVFNARLLATPPLYSETDPIFSARLLATPPLYSETDPIFSAWLLATPPLYSESDPLSWHLDGNTLGAKKTLGSNDNYDIGFETNGTERITILASNGYVGFGTIAPTYDLSFGNDAAKKIWIENSGAGVVGRDLTLASGNAVSGTDIAGGNLILSSGVGTGNATSTISFYTGTTLTTGSTLQTISEKMTILGNGNVGIGKILPTAVLELKAGTTTAGKAPLKFNSGSLLTTSEIGAVEFNNDDYYATITSGTDIMTPEYPFAQNATYVKATSTFNSSYYPYFTTDPAKSLTGAYTGNQWISGNGSLTNQRFHIDLGSEKVITNIYYENLHDSGSYTGNGARAFTFWGSNDPTSFSELTYGTDTGWTQLTTSTSELERHVAVNTADPKYIIVTNDTAYRYYAFKFANVWSNEATNAMGVRRIVLRSGTNTGTRTGIILNNGTKLVSGRVPYATTNGRLNDSANLVFTGTNLGIGTTTTPANIISLGNTQAQKIWIENTANTVAGKDLTLAAGSTVTGGTNNQAGGSLILSSGAGKGTGASTISFQTGTTLTSGNTLQTLSTKMTILGSGFVGIGTTAPYTKLDIYHTGTGTGDLPGSLNSREYGLVLRTDPSLANTRPGFIQYCFRTAGGFAYSMMKGMIGVDAANATQAGVIGLYGAIGATSATNSVKYMYLDASSTGTYNSAALKIGYDGQIGIGIASDNEPQYTFHVEGDDFPVIGGVRRVATTNTFASGMALITRSSGDAVDGHGGGFVFCMQDTGVTALTGTLASVGATRYGADNSGRLEFRTYSAGTPTIRSVILPSGYFGIGVDVPTRKLHVASSSSTAVEASNRFELASDDTTGWDLRLDKARGNLGNRTNISSGDVLGTISWNGVHTSTYTTGAQIKVVSTGTIAQDRIPAYMSFFTATDANPSVLTERMRILANGNIGIGTSSPTNILSLGNTQAQKIWIENTASGTVGRELTLSAGSTVSGGTNIAGGNLTLNSGSGTGTGASRIVFSTGTTLGSGTTAQTIEEKATILGNGNFGIGVLVPNEMLEVNAKIRANTAFNLNGTDGISESSSGVPTAITASGGIITAITKTTPVADGTYNFDGSAAGTVASMTITNGIITAITTR